MPPYGRWGFGERNCFENEGRVVGLWDIPGVIFGKGMAAVEKRSYIPKLSVNIELDII